MENYKYHEPHNNVNIHTVAQKLKNPIHKQDYIIRGGGIHVLNMIARVYKARWKYSFAQHDSTSTRKSKSI